MRFFLKIPFKCFSLQLFSAGSLSEMSISHRKRVTQCSLSQSSMPQPSSLRSWDNSTSNLQCTLFLKFGSHYFVVNISLTYKTGLLILHHTKRKFLSKIVKALNLLHSIFLASAYLTNQGADKNRSWYADPLDEASGNF